MDIAEGVPFLFIACQEPDHPAYRLRNVIPSSSKVPSHKDLANWILSVIGEEVECPASFVLVKMRQTGTRGAVPLLPVLLPHPKIDGVYKGGASAEILTKLSTNTVMSPRPSFVRRSSNCVPNGCCLRGPPIQLPRLAECSIECFAFSALDNTALTRVRQAGIRPA
jgi:hypothetical protein